MLVNTAKHILLRCPLKKTYTVRAISSKGVEIQKCEENDYGRASERLSAAITEGEKVVAYPTSFLNLRWLLNDEIANTAMQVRQLMLTQHPLIKTLRKLVSNTGTSTWSLIILLISKACGLNVPSTQETIAGILPNQRALAEVVQMIQVSQLLHNSILNCEGEKNESPEIKCGNQLSLLGGDYLLSQAFKILAEMKNHEVKELISVASRDLYESNFIGPRDNQNEPLPAKPLENSKKVQVVDNADAKPFRVAGILGNAEPEWTLRNLLDGGSLLGKSCQASVVLAEFPEEIQKQAYYFGKHFALAEKAQEDMQIFLKESFEEPFSLVAAPVLFHLEANSSFYEEIDKGKTSIRKVDYKKIWTHVKNGSGVEQTRKMQKEHLNSAAKALENFASSDAKNSLTDILKALEAR